MADETKITSPLRCGHCLQIGSMEIRCEDVIVTWREASNPTQPSTYNCTEVLRCLVCGKLTLRTYPYYDGIAHDDDVSYTTLYPGSSGIPAGLPEQVEKEFAVGQRVKDIDGNLFGIQLRRILELVCEDRLGPDPKEWKDGLKKRLKELADKGEIPPSIAEVADHARLFGDIGAHPSMGSGIKPEHLSVVEKLCVAVLEYVYTMPKLVDDAKKLVEEITRGRKPPPKS